MIPAARRAPVLALAVATLALAAEPPLAGARVGPFRQPSAPEAWGGVRTGAEPTRSQGVADYQLTAVLDPQAHTVEGHARLTWRNRSSAPIGALPLHLYLNAFESEGSTFAVERRRLGAFRSGVETEAGEWGFIELLGVTQAGRAVPWHHVHPDDGPASDHTVALLELPTPVPPGGETVLELDFHDQLPRVVARTGWFGGYHLVGQWYPKVGVLELPGERGATAPRWSCHEFHLNSEFSADFGSYALEVVAPAGVTVGASGVPAGEPTTDAQGVHHRFQADDVHDAVFTAWDGYAPPLTGHTAVPGGGEVAVEVLFPPEYEGSARVALLATLDAVRYFSAALGPYPYPKVTVVVPPYNAGESGGMEYETLFTTVGGASLPLGSPALVRFVTVHEFGHGYFMGMLASDEFEEPFLDEGVNEWVDNRMLGGEPFDAELPRFARWLGVSLPRLGQWDLERASGTNRFPADPIGAASWGRWSTGSYGQVYTRTALVMHDLGQLLGEDVTVRALRAYFARWRFRHPSAADLREAFVEAGGDRQLVEAWFDAQVYGAAPLDDRVEKVEAAEALPELGRSLEDGGILEEEAREAWVKARRAAFTAEHGEPGPGQPGPFPCRSTVAVRRYGAAVPRTLELTFEGDAGTERLDWPAAEPWKRLELERPTCLASARLDAAGPLFLDLDRLDDVRTREAKPTLAAGLVAVATAWLQLAFALVEAL